MSGSVPPPEFGAGESFAAPDRPKEHNGPPTRHGVLGGLAAPSELEHRDTVPLTTTLDVTGLTHRGAVRPENQDAAGAGRWMLADGVVGAIRLPVTAPTACCVADGAGGHPAGRRASGAVVSEYLSRALAMDERADIGEAVLAAHERLRREMVEDPACEGMGSTIAALLATPTDVFLANVGDSRIYEMLSDGLVQLSIDDTPARPDFVPDSATTSVLTQMLGGPRGVHPPAPHLERCSVEHGLRFLLCSDGLAAALADDEVERIVASAPRDADAAQRLVDSAIARGAPDNVTVLFARIHHGEAP